MSLESSTETAGDGEAPTGGFTDTSGAAPPSVSFLHDPLRIAKSHPMIASRLARTSECTSNNELFIRVARILAHYIFSSWVNVAINYCFVTAEKCQLAFALLATIIKDINIR